MKDTEGLLALLQDIKEMLWGLILLLTGLALCALAWPVNNGLALLPLMAGIIICASGLYYAYHGFTHHEVVEKKDET